MAKPSKQKEIEFEPDAWKRFTHAVKIVAKSPPQHRTKTKQKPSPGKAKRVKKNGR